MKKKSQTAKAPAPWYRRCCVWIWGTVAAIIFGVVTGVPIDVIKPRITDWCRGILARWNSPKREPPSPLIQIEEENDSAPALGDYPPTAELAHPPSKEAVKNRSRVPPEKVIFNYRNATGVPLKLLMFNWHYHYFPPKNTPLAPSPWKTYDLPATNRLIPISKFSREGTGWYTFYVQRIDTRQRYQLGTHNIFDSELPVMIVSTSNDPANPFTVKFIVGDQP